MLPAKSLALKNVLTLAVFVTHVLFIVPLIWCYYQADELLQKDVISEQIIADATTMSRLFYDAGLAMGAFSLTKNQGFMDRYDKILNQIPSALDNIHRLIDKQPVKEVSFSDIQSLVQDAINQLQNAKLLLKNDNISPLGAEQGEVRTLYKKVKSLADQLQNKLDQLCQAESDLSKNNSKARQAYQLVLVLFFSAYLGFNLSIHLKYFRSIANSKI